MKRNLLWLLILPAMFIGCASTSPANISAVGDFSVPRAGEVMSVGVGDNLIRQGLGYEADCIIPYFSHSEAFGLGVVIINIEAGKPLCEKDYEGYYWPKYETVTTGYDRMKHWVEVEDKGEATEYCVAATYCFVKPSNSHLKARQMVVADDAVEQTLEYMGKSGDVLEFTYAEFINGLARNSFTRTFSLDLNETKTLSFKGAEIAIIEASGAEVSYKILSGFR